MLRKISSSVFILLVLFACSNDTNTDDIEDSIVRIKTGTVCGWCTVNDTLTITGTSVRYVNYANCSNSNPAVQKTGQITTSELDALLSKLDYTKLKNIELNSCNVCADGCDDWISYTNGTDSHTIRFGGNEPELQQIKAFIDELNVIKLEYSSGN